MAVRKTRSNTLANLEREWRICRRQSKLDDGVNDMCVDPCKRCDRMLAYRRKHPQPADFSANNIRHLMKTGRTKR